MIGSFKFDGGIQTILLVVLILVIGGYLYLEIRKLSSEVSRLKKLCVREKDIEDPPSLSTLFQSPKDGPVDPTPKTQLMQTQDMQPKPMQPQAMQPQDMQPQSVFMQGSLKSLMEQTMIDETPNEAEVDEGSMISEVSTTMNDADIASNDADIEINDADISTNDADIETNDADVSTNDADDVSDIKIITKDQDPYQDMTVSELKAILQERGLPLSGNKTKLINRIKDNVTVEKM